MMAKGTIKRLFEKGFGFIYTGAPKDLFFKSSSVQGVSFDDLYEGQSVSYSVFLGRHGPCADEIKPIDDSASSSKPTTHGNSPSRDCDHQLGHQRLQGRHRLSLRSGPP